LAGLIWLHESVWVVVLDLGYYPANGEGASLEINIGPHEAAKLLGAQSGIEGQFHISAPFVRRSVSENDTYFL